MIAMRRGSWTLVVLCGALAAGARADVIQVEPGGRPLQQVVDLAQPGDVILLAPGEYGERVEIVGKGLTLIGDGGSAGLHQVIVREVPTGQTVLLRWLSIDDPGSVTSDSGALALLSCEGAVRVEGCTVEGAPASGQDYDDGSPASRITDCRSVMIATSHLSGGYGASSEWSDGTNGGAGLEIEGSQVVVLDSLLRGTNGGSVYGMVPWGTGGHGGHAVINGQQGLLHLAGSLLIGGWGGNGSCDDLGLFVGWGGNGGHGLLQTSGTASSSTRDCIFDPGVAGGLLSVCDWWPGRYDGEEIVIQAGDYVEYPTAHRAFQASSPVPEAFDLELSFSVLDGDQVLVWGALEAGHTSMSGLQGVLLFEPTSELAALPIPLPPGGSTVPLTVGELPPGLDSIDLHLQMIVHSTTDGLLLGPASVTTLLDVRDLPIEIECPEDVTVECGGSTDPTQTGQATGSSPCGPVTITFSDSSVSGCGLSETITRTWIVTDDCWNIIKGVQVITVLDTTAPAIDCPPDVTVECKGYTDPSHTGVATASDLCGEATITYADSSAPGCGGTETIARTWTATDACGKEASAVQIVTVVDTGHPVIGCPPDQNVACGSELPAPALDLGEFVAQGGSAFDGCSGAIGLTLTWLGDTTQGSGPDLQTLRGYRVTDPCGNRAECEQLFHWVGCP
jgi:hypothetical protein